MKNPFIKASAKRKYLKIYLYGDSGVGKTYFALTFPDAAVIDLEGGTDFYSERFQFQVLDTKSFSEVLDAIKFLEHEKHDFKTLIIDPVTIIWSALQDGRLEFKAKNINKVISGEEKEDFNYKDWGQLKRFYSILMTKLVNLPMNIILIAREKDEYEISGNKMTKIGIKPEAEKSTPYVADIRFRLIVDGNGKRIAIFEKDRTGHFDRGTRIENPSFETFKSLIEENGQSDQKLQAMHQNESEASQKDAEFFQQQEQNYSNFGKKSDKQKLLSKIEAPLATLFTMFNNLGISAANDAYKQYMRSKYNVDSTTKLTFEQRQEQRKILQGLKENEENRKKFEEMLLSLTIQNQKTIQESNIESTPKDLLFAFLSKTFNNNAEEIIKFIREKKDCTFEWLTEEQALEILEEYK